MKLVNSLVGNFNRIAVPLTGIMFSDFKQLSKDTDTGLVTGIGLMWYVQPHYNEDSEAVN